MSVNAPNEPPGAAPSGAIDWEDPSTLPLDEVRELFLTLAKALRAYQLYDENNPVYKRFVGSLRQAFGGLWEILERLPVQVEEDRITWLREPVYVAENRSDSLAFLFYKDGVRDITFLPGIEGDELERFLSVMQRARSLRPESDDLLTILWEEDFTRFQYHYVDVLADPIDIPQIDEDKRPDLTSILRAEIEDRTTESGQVTAGTGEDEGAVEAPTTPDFNKTLYSLDPKEMELLRQEVEKEAARDLRTDVLAALFDRLEDGASVERQAEILGILRTLLPNFLSRGEIRAATLVLEEIAGLLRDGDVLHESLGTAAESIVDELSAPESMEELIRALQDGSIRPSPTELGDFLRYLGRGALEPLVRAAEETDEKELRPVLREAVRGIAEQNRAAILELLGSTDPVVVAGVARLAGRIQLTEAGARLAQLLSHEDERVQLAAIEAAVNLKASTAVGALEAALKHQDRDIRIAAARGLGALRYEPGEKALRQAITGKRIRQADLSEKIALFEAYGVLAGDSGVTLLDRMLNSRGFLGKREAPDIRACAALALGKVRTAAAHKALQSASREDDPVVKSAVNRALRGEE